MATAPSIEYPFSSPVFFSLQGLDLPYDARYLLSLTNPWFFFYVCRQSFPAKTRTPARHENTHGTRLAPHSQLFFVSRHQKVSISPASSQGLSLLSLKDQMFNKFALICSSGPLSDSWLFVMFQPLFFFPYFSFLSSPYRPFAYSSF